MVFRINACLAPLLVLNLSSAYAYVARPRGEEQVADPQQDSDPAEQLRRSLGHQMDVLSQSVAFCEEKKDFLSRNAPEDIRKFCSSSGIPTIKKCLTESKDSSQASDCLLPTLKSVSVSRPMASCLCQSMLDTNLSLSGTSHVVCSEPGDRAGRWIEGGGNKGDCPNAASV